MAGGRPTKLTKELMAKAKEYLATYEDHGDVVPSNAGLGVYLEVSRKTIHNWKEESEEFLHILDQIAQLQEQKLLSGGLSNTFNSTITKLMLTKHDYSDKVAQDVTSNGETVKTFTELYGKPKSESD